MDFGRCPASMAFWARDGEKPDRVGGFPYYK